MTTRPAIAPFRLAAKFDVVAAVAAAPGSVKLGSGFGWDKRHGQGSFCRQQKTVLRGGSAKLGRSGVESGWRRT
jgi:hypothetical protein